MRNAALGLALYQMYSGSAPAVAPIKCLRLCRSGTICRLFGTVSTKKYDVAILGAGVMGCSVAYHLSQMSPDISIALIERESSYKNSATVRSAGGIRHQFSNKENILLSQYGTEFLRNAPMLLRVDEEAPDLQFMEKGYLFLASERGVDTLNSNYRTQRAVKADIAYLLPEQIRLRYPWMSMDGVVAGTLGEKNEGWFDPWSLLISMKKKCCSLGVDFIQGEVGHINVSEGTLHNASVNLMDASGKAIGGDLIVEAGNFVNATGPWAAKILEACGSFDYPVKPRKRSVFVFNCPAQEIWKGPAASPMVIDPSGVYFRPEGSGGNFICGTSPDATQDLDGEDNNELGYLDHNVFTEYIWPILATRVPQFEELKVINAWAGWYDYNTFDQNAILGLHPDFANLYLINGFSGHGLQQSPGAGRAIAELICYGKYESIDVKCFKFDRIRFEEPCYEINVV